MFHGDEDIWKEDGWILLQLVEENLGRIEIKYVCLEEIFVNSNVNNLKIITYSNDCFLFLRKTLTRIPETYILQINTI